MIKSTTIEALAAIWDELPDLAGDYWKVLDPQLEALLADFTATTDPGDQDRISLAIQQALEGAPVAVITRFDEVFVLIPHGLESFRGNPLKLLMEKIGRQRPTESITCYTDISCPRQVWIQDRRVQVSVRLTRKSRDYSASLQTLTVRKEIPVLVCIDAPGFEILGTSTQDIIMLPDRDSDYRVFDLCPKVEGATHIILSFLQAGNPAGTASIPVEIVRHQIDKVSEYLPGPPLSPSEEENISPADFYLYITYEQSQTSPKLFFRLLSMRNVGTGDPIEDFAPIQLPNLPEIFATEIYRDITVLTQRLDPVTDKVLGQERRLRPADAEDRLKSWGKYLWSMLIPERLRERYAREREQWRERSLLIISDEPYIPWELLWPYDPDGYWTDDGPLCLSMNIARWLRRGPQGAATPKPISALDIHALGLIIPPDSGLPAAQRELTFLRELLNQHNLQDVSPPEPTYTAVKHLLSQGLYTWLHVAAHGNFYPLDPNSSSAIWLQDQQCITPLSIIGEIETYVRRQRPSFVFNACEVGRQGWSITGIGGWANQLICSGAGMFLAPMWNVTDRAALTFSRTLYLSLMDKKTIAEAVRQARFAARSTGNPSWLAYSLYAHPNARMTPNMAPIAPNG